jgi:hypothetical protein
VRKHRVVVGDGAFAGVAAERLSENQRIESHGGETKGNMILQKFARRSYLLREEKGGRKREREGGGPSWAN